MGAIGLDGQMDIALALRTMVVPVDHARRGVGGLDLPHPGLGRDRRRQQPGAEFMETVNKAAALGRAVDLAEQAFGANDS
jgi:anthranilate synthase component 1